MAQGLWHERPGACSAAPALGISRRGWDFLTPSCALRQRRGTEAALQNDSRCRGCGACLIPPLRENTLRGGDVRAGEP